MSWQSRVRSDTIQLTRRALRTLYAARLRQYPELRSLMASFHASRSAAIDLSDAIALFEHVVQRRPTGLLELGAGTSSAVLALAITEVQRVDPTYRPRFVAVEENPDWLEYHVAQTPKALSAHIQWMTCPVRVKVLDGWQVAHYADLPPMTVDFLHIDGPDLAAHAVDASSDASDLLRCYAPSALIAFDGREATSRLCKRRLEEAGFRFSRHRFTLNHRFVRTP